MHFLEFDGLNKTRQFNILEASDSLPNISLLTFHKFTSHLAPSTGNFENVFKDSVVKCKPG